MLTLLFLLPLLAAPVFGWSYDNHTCAIEPRFYSCENTTADFDSCCSPGNSNGLVLVTQYWDTYTGLESSGQVLPKGNWGIHGLWPDHCDGTYGQYCDLARQYDPFPSPNTTTGTPSGIPVPAWTDGDIIAPLLNKYGKYDLLAYMQKYWISQGSPGWIFWQHEFSKHATCFTTYDVGNNGSPNCYGLEYVNDTEASIIGSLESVIQAQIQYPTYTWLQQAGITPSNTTMYKLSQLQDVLTKASGAVPYLGCFGATHQILDEVWYYSHSLGRPQDGIFKPIDQTGHSSCNATEPIYYYQRTIGSEE